MASSNRHWPSMFKSKPCNTHHHHQWQHHDIISSGCHRSPYSSGCEERSPEPKPRWNPKPEQIRILEAIFNSGMVNPPRDEIRKIRAQLQEYGQVGDANVFYWFQNRKSRSKHKQRNLQNAAAKSQNNQLHHQPPISTTTTAPTSSSSSSDKSSPNSNKAFSLLNSPTGSVNQQVQPYFGEFLQEPYFFQPGYHVGSTNAASGEFTQGFGFPELGNVIHGNGNDQTVGSSSLLTDFLMMNHEISPKNGGGNNTKAEGEKMRMQQQLNYYTQPPSTSAVHSIPPPTSSVNIPSPISQVQGMGENGGFGFGRSTVFINDMPIDVGAGPIDVREAIGDDCVLIHSTGQLVLTDEWGVTIQPLQHGASYYVVPRSFNPSPLGTLIWYSPYHPTNTNLIRI